MSARVNHQIIVSCDSHYTVNNDSCMVEEHAIDSGLVFSKLPIRSGHQHCDQSGSIVKRQ